MYDAPAAVEINLGIFKVQIPTFREHRAKLAQKKGWPLGFLFRGKWGTSIPLHENTLTVTFDPFPITDEKTGEPLYNLELINKQRKESKEKGEGEQSAELDRAHNDYKAYLKKCFDEYKDEVPGTTGKTLVFVDDKESTWRERFFPKKGVQGEESSKEAQEEESSKLHNCRSKTQ